MSCNCFLPPSTLVSFNHVCAAHEDSAKFCVRIILILSSLPLIAFQSSTINCEYTSFRRIAVTCTVSTWWMRAQNNFCCIFRRVRFDGALWDCRASYAQGVCARVHVEILWKTISLNALTITLWTRDTPKRIRSKCFDYSHETKAKLCQCLMWWICTPFLNDWHLSTCGTDPWIAERNRESRNKKMRCIISLQMMSLQFFYPPFDSNAFHIKYNVK